MKKTKLKGKYPDYPHYSTKEDITSNNKKVDADLENYSKQSGKIKPNKLEDNIQAGPTSIPKTTGTKSKPGKNDLTKDDLNILGSVDQDMDEGEDETLLPNIKMNDEMMGGDLDVPWNDLSDEDSDPEDEENNLYSQGQN